MRRIATAGGRHGHAARKQTVKWSFDTCATSSRSRPKGTSPAPPGSSASRNFDGKTLDGWDGNPKFWRVDDGAIVGESTPEKPSGNSHIAYRRMEAKGFTLKFAIKVEGTGGSGLQYRSRTGLPWLANIPIDDDPAWSNNRSGQFGIEIEATTKVSVRNIWVKRVD